MLSSEVTPQSAPLHGNLYASDFFAWTHQQALYIRNQDWERLDLANLIEEIDSLGRQQRQELKNRLSILVGDLLKWEYQPQNRSNSWKATLQIQRLDIAELIADNPSLKPELEQLLSAAYLKAVALAVLETNLSDQVFPATCPYALVDILDDGFFPGK